MSAHYFFVDFNLACSLVFLITVLCFRARRGTRRRGGRPTGAGRSLARRGARRPIGKGEAGSGLAPGRGRCGRGGGWVAFRDALSIGRRHKSESILPCLRGFKLRTSSWSDRTKKNGSKYIFGWGGRGSDVSAEIPRRKYARPPRCRLKYSRAAGFLKGRRPGLPLSFPGTKERSSRGRGPRL